MGVGGDPASIVWYTAGLSVPTDRELVSCCEEDPVTGERIKRKFASLLMRYVGGDCEDTTNSQCNEDGNKCKVKCSTDPNCDPLPNPAYIVVDNKKKDSKNRVWFDGFVALNEEYLIDSNFGGESELNNDTRICIYTDMSKTVKCQKVEFHSSCSKPLDAGDQFAAHVLEECIPVNGNGNGGDGECKKGSDFKIASLKVTYTGASCSGDNNFQCDDKGNCKAECDTTCTPMPTDARIVVTNKDNEELFNELVSIGGEFEILASAIGKTKLDADTFVRIFDSTGTVQCQLLRIHTSCSKELAEGAKHGAITVNALTLIPK